jgi:hypothetical protein
MNVNWKTGVPPVENGKICKYLVTIGSSRELMVLSYHNKLGIRVGWYDRYLNIFGEPEAWTELPEAYSNIRSLS